MYTNILLLRYREVLSTTRGHRFDAADLRILQILGSDTKPLWELARQVAMILQLYFTILYDTILD